MHATCSIHMQQCLAELTILDPNFRIVGVQTQSKGASRYIICETLKTAAAAGILQLANDKGLWPKSLLTMSDIDAHLEHLCDTVRAPCAFMFMKWKTQETQNDWCKRLLITHAQHPLRRFSKQMGRCLTVLLKESHCAFPFWRTPSMTNVRDIWATLQRAPPGGVQFWERNIDNAYWNLDKAAVQAAITRAAQLVRKHRGMRGEFLFSIAKGSLKKLDRIGSATDRNFRVFTLQNVKDFVEWDLFQSTLFTIWGVVLQQAKQGVPIGGYISAQLMCIWA